MERKEEALTGLQFERVLRWCISKLFLELKSFNEGHSDRLLTSLTGFPVRLRVLADCFVVPLCARR